MPLAEGELTPDLLTELAQYRRLFNNLPAEIGVFDLEGRFCSTRRPESPTHG